MDRTTQISDRLVAYFRDTLHIRSSSIPAEDWKGLAVYPGYRFGWLPPLDLTEEGIDELIAITSPELIAKVTAELNDDQLDTYLTVVEAMMAAFVERRGEPTEAVERAVEDLLYAEAADAILLRHETEAGAIDRGIIPAICSSH